MSDYAEDRFHRTLDAALGRAGEGVISDILRDHVIHGGSSGGRWNADCLADGCHWSAHGDAGGFAATVDAHRAHVTALVTDLLAQCIEQAKAEERRKAAAVHRDLTSRLGFGDGITEPQADNDTIVAWFEQQSRDANEWQESQLWRNDCYAAGHPDDDDCRECDPRFAADRARAEERERIASAIEAQREEIDPESLGWYDGIRHGLTEAARIAREVPQ